MEWLVAVQDDSGRLFLFKFAFDTGIDI